MELRIIFKKSVPEMTTKQLLKLISYFNTETAEAHFKRLGDERIEIMISKREILKDICNELGIEHFTKKEDYKAWLNGNRKKTRYN